MNRILETSTADTLAVVQPGVVTADLQQAVERVRLFYPPDPASVYQCTIGGNVATNAGGPRCLKYGVTADYVLGLTVVLPGGYVMRTGGRTIKDVAGYNLTQLFVGSEGTLGVITEITLRLIPKPAAQLTALAVFPRLADACAAVGNILQAGIVPLVTEPWTRHDARRRNFSTWAPDRCRGCCRLLWMATRLGQREIAGRRILPIRRAPVRRRERGESSRGNRRGLSPAIAWRRTSLARISQRAAGPSHDRPLPRSRAPTTCRRCTVISATATPPRYVRPATPR
jgi:hypothetical protein